MLELSKKIEKYIDLISKKSFKTNEIFNFTLIENLKAGLKNLQCFKSNSYNLNNDGMFQNLISLIIATNDMDMHHMALLAQLKENYSDYLLNFIDIKSLSTILKMLEKKEESDDSKLEILNDFIKKQVSEVQKLKVTSRKKSKLDEIHFVLDTLDEAGRFDIIYFASLLTRLAHKNLDDLNEAIYMYPDILNLYSKLQNFKKENAISVEVETLYFAVAFYAQDTKTILPFISLMKKFTNSNLIRYWETYERLSFGKNVATDFARLTNNQYSIGLPPNSTKELENLYLAKIKDYNKINKKINTDLNAQIDYLQTLLKNLPKWEQEDYYISVNSDYIANLLETIANDFYPFIFAHNQKIFQKALAKKEEFESRESYPLDEVLRKFSLAFNFEPNFIKTHKNNLTAMALKLEALLKNDFSFILTSNEALEDILIKSDVSKINMLGKIVRENNIKKTDIMAHFRIFTDDYLTFTRNIILGAKQKINVQNFETYLIDTKEFIAKINLATAYGIDVRASLNVDLLLNSSSGFANLDKLIELGLASFTIDYAILDNEKVIKRAALKNSLGIDTSKEEIINEVIKGHNSLVEDSNLDNYLTNDVMLVANLKYLEDLNNLDCLEPEIVHPKLKYFDEHYKENAQVYNLEGILISRLKVIRCFNALASKYKDDNIEEILFNSIIYNSYLDFPSLNKISQIVYGRFVKLTYNQLT